MLDFGAQYLAIREKEGRNYADEVLRKLPEIAENHQHFVEWQIRKRSAARVWADFRAQQRPFKMLDLGCGNGWFAHGLSQIPQSKILALDVAGPEIEQAKRVFADLAPALSFAATDIFSPTLDSERFDRITLGASIQYFDDLNEIMARLRTLLAEKGEIHVFDSPFYALDALAEAKKRSEAYYSSMGFPDLARFYHHHSFKQALELGAILRRNPKSFATKIAAKFSRQPDSPFPWLVFR